MVRKPSVVLQRFSYGSDIKSDSTDFWHFVDMVTADADHDSDDEDNGNMTDGVIGMIKGLMLGIIMIIVNLDL